MLILLRPLSELKGGKRAFPEASYSERMNLALEKKLILSYEQK